MNICFLTSEYPVATCGGIERVTITLKEYFESQGIQVFGISRSAPQKQEEMIAKFDILPENKTALDNKVFFHDFCQKNNISIIINNSHHTDMLLFAACEREYGARVISCLHIDPYAIRKSIIDHVVCEQWRNRGIKKIIKVAIALIKVPLRYYLHAKNQKTKYLQLVSNSDICILESQYYIAPFKKIIGENVKCSVGSIPNPYILPSYELKKTKDNIKTILWLGRMNIMQKRPDQMIKIWEKLWSQFPEWKLLMCGDGPDVEYLMSYCKKHNIGNISFPGRVNSLDYTPHATILCITSSFEGWGLVIPEALSWNCPVVSFRTCSATKELIKDRVNGVIVSPRSVHKMTQELKKLMLSPHLLSRMSEADKTYLQNFSLENVGKSWMVLFEKLYKQDAL